MEITLHPDILSVIELAPTFIRVDSADRYSNIGEQFFGRYHCSPSVYYIKNGEIYYIGRVDIPMLNIPLAWAVEAMTITSSGGEQLCVITYPGGETNVYRYKL